MFKQQLNQSVDGGRLDIPKNSKWCIAAGICMIAAIILRFIWGIEYRLLFLGHGHIEPNTIKASIAIVLCCLPFVVISFLPKKNIKLYLIPIVISIVLILGNSSIFIRLSVKIGIHIPALSNLMYYNLMYGFIEKPFYDIFCFLLLCQYITLLILSIAISSGKIHKRRSVLYTFLIIFIVYSIIEFMLWYSNPTSFWGKYFVSDIFLFVPYILLLFGINNIFCPKCGAPLTNARKFCNICGEQLTIK